MSDLLVVVPSRGRPSNAYDLMVAFQETGATADLLFVLDRNDKAEQFYPTAVKRMVLQEQLLMVPKLNSAVGNALGSHRYVAFMGDDHRPRTQGWDARICAELDALGTGIVYGNDLLAGERLPTQVAMTSDIVTTLGWMALPGLQHLWCDNVWWDLGHAIDRIRYLPDVIVVRLHPLAGKAPEDAGYLEVNHPDAAEADRLIYADWYEHQMPNDVEKLRALL